MQTHSLTVQQERALLALASGASRRDAAAAARVDDRTIRRWLRDPAFGCALSDTRRLAWAEASTLVQHGAAEAVRALIELLNESPDPRVRIRVAQVLLTWGHRLAQADLKALQALQEPQPVAPEPVPAAGDEPGPQRSPAANVSSPVTYPEAVQPSETSETRTKADITGHRRPPARTRPGHHRPRRR